MIGLGDKLKITKVETILVKPRWLFLKIHTNAGITGLGEPIVEGRAKTVATAIEELAPYLIGKDPRPVAHHWQAMYRHAFYRGGPILTSAHQRRGPGALGHQGQGARRAGLRVARRADAHPRARLCARRNGRANQTAQGGRLHRFQDRALQGTSRAHRREQGVHRQGGETLRRTARSRRRRMRHRHRLPRRDQPADGEAADQGAGAVSADVHRRAGELPGGRCDGGHRARHAPADCHGRTHFYQVGIPGNPREKAPPRFCSRTFVTPAASPSAV